MQGLLKNKVVRWLPAFLWMGTIFYLSAKQGNGFHSPSTIYFLERKVFHVLEFMVLTALLFWAFRADLSKIEAAKKALIFAAIFAFTDEWHQTAVPGRDGTLRDVGIDFLGIALMTLIIFNYPRWKKKWLK